MNFLTVLLILLTTLKIYAQSEDTKEKVVFISPFYELQFPFADMKADFGVNSNLGLELSLINDNNIYLSISGSFLFGSQVKDTTILDHLMDDNNNIIDENGQIAEILLNQRGFNTNLKLGYLYPIIHENSGLLAYGSIGFHQHKIHIDVKNSNVPQLDTDGLFKYQYKKWNKFLCWYGNYESYFIQSKKLQSPCRRPNRKNAKRFILRF